MSASFTHETEHDSRADVVHLLLLFQAAAGLLSGAAMLLFMGGNPLALPLTLGVPLLMFGFAAGVVRGRCWARKGALWIRWLLLIAFLLGIFAGLLAAVDFTFNLMSLITNLVLPVGIIRLIRAQPSAAEIEEHSDPWVAA